MLFGFQQIMVNIKVADFIGQDYLKIFDGGSEDVEVLANFTGAAVSGNPSFIEPNLEATTMRPATEATTYQEIAQNNDTLSQLSLYSSGTQIVIAMVSDASNASTGFLLYWIAIGKHKIFM